LLTRYNSLVALPSGNHGLRVNLTERDTGLNMGMHHPTLPIHTLQAHPESIGSPEGASLLRAFLEIESDG
jgi:anthranilate synthase component 2